MVNLLRLKISNNLLSLADCASSALRARSSHPSHAVGLELLGQTCGPGSRLGRGAGLADFFHRASLLSTDTR
jgi:hypothetical protein